MKNALSLGCLLGSWIIIIYFFVNYVIDGEIHLISLLFAIAVSMIFGIFALYLRIGEQK